MIKSAIKANKINFKKSSFQMLIFSEIAMELSRRLCQVRLFQNMKQTDLATRTGLSLGTIKKFEAGLTISLHNFLRIVCALGLNSELEKLFLIQAQSISDLEKIEKLQNKKVRRRAR